jgi:hypothetical protein
MHTNYSIINFNAFVDNKLTENGCRLLQITKEIMERRIDEFIDFVNRIRTEYKSQYEWNAEPREYFLNGLVDKWKYSFAIVNQKDEICFVNFSFPFMVM